MLMALLCALASMSRTRTSECPAVNFQFNLSADHAARFFTRVDRVLRRSLGVPENAKADETVKPAPPVDPTLPRFKPEHEPLKPFVDQDAGDGKPGIILPDHMKDKVSIEMEEIDEDGNVVLPHDEL